MIFKDLVQTYLDRTSLSVQFLQRLKQLVQVHLVPLPANTFWSSDMVCFVALLLTFYPVFEIVQLRIYFPPDLTEKNEPQLVDILLSSSISSFISSLNGFTSTASFSTWLSAQLIFVFMFQFYMLLQGLTEFWQDLEPAGGEIPATHSTEIACPVLKQKVCLYRQSSHNYSEQFSPGSAVVLLWWGKNYTELGDPLFSSLFLLRSTAPTFTLLASISKIYVFHFSILAPWYLFAQESSYSQEQSTVPKNARCYFKSCGSSRSFKSAVLCMYSLRRSYITLLHNTALNRD